MVGAASSSRGLETFLRFLSDRQLSVPAVTRVHIGTCLASFQRHDRCLSNATVQQRLTVIRLFYSYLVEEGVCKTNPVRQGGSRALVRRQRKLPWIPNEDDWQAILAATMQEPVRNRVMLTFAYDAGPRREELCSLCTDDIDPSRRMIRVRAENTKGRRDRIVPYSATSGALLIQYLDQRRTVGQKRGSHGATIRLRFPSGPGRRLPFESQRPPEFLDSQPTLFVTCA
jgi:integrase/recombinase XerD